MVKILITSILIILCATFSTYADMYQWVDENGVKHFSNTAPPPKADIEKKVEVESKYIPAPKKPASTSKALSDYKKTLLQKQKTYRAKQRTSTPSRAKTSSNNNMRDYYKSMVEKYEKRVKSRKDDLNDVKRESYSDSRRHRKKVQRGEDRLETVKAELKRYQKKYAEAKR